MSIKNGTFSYNRYVTKKRPGKVQCLKCQKWFDSPDKTRIRICGPCKNGEVFKYNPSSVIPRGW